MAGSLVTLKYVLRDRGLAHAQEPIMFAEVTGQSQRRTGACPRSFSFPSRIM